jgi:tRNA(His) guanylyltransferase
MDKTSLGDRMKSYEAREAGRRFMPLLPICARIDGKNFSKWTRGLQRPYDERLSRLMQRVLEALVRETGALIGYTQSDEFSLLFHSDTLDSQVFFDGRIQKMTSVLAALTTARFNQLLSEHLPERAEQPALFDCRVWQLPNRDEAANALLWREQDATKNSIAMAAHDLFSHRELHGKSGKEMQSMMLLHRDLNWNDFPAFFKRGTFVQRKKVVRAFTPEELDVLPPKHAARENPDLEVERTVVKQLQMPPFGSVTNRCEVIFDGADPITAATP